MITDEQWDDIAKKIFALPGMRTEADSDCIIEDDEADGETYIKFMSDHGVTDDHNGTTFAAYLTANGCVLEQSRARSMTVPTADLVRLFGYQQVQ